MRRKPSPPSVRLVILTLGSSPTPLTYKQLEDATDVSLETIKKTVPPLIRNGLLARIAVASGAHFSLPSPTEINSAEVAQ